MVEQTALETRPEFTDEELHILCEAFAENFLRQEDWDEDGLPINPEYKEIYLKLWPWDDSL